jgi:hypothetical protein
MEKHPDGAGHRDLDLHLPTPQRSAAGLTAVSTRTLPARQDRGALHGQDVLVDQLTEVPPDLRLLGLDGIGATGRAGLVQVEEAGGGRAPRRCSS